jgi:predicted MFS family arabinose efflux permease
VASDFGVSTAEAGQLRTASGLAAGLTALVLMRVTQRRSLREFLRLGALLLAAGSVGTIAAPSFAVVALAQVVVGIGVGLLVSAATAAAGEWAPSGDGGRLLSRTLIGAPAAWICGMPLVGFVANADWRLSLALPIVAGAAVLVPRTPAAPPRPVSEQVGSAVGTARWTLAELLANAGWTGLLVYAGALFVDSYSTSLTLTGFLLAAGAVAYVGGNLASRRLLRDDLGPNLIRLSALLALAIAALGTLRQGVVVSAVLFAVCGSLAGGRTLLANAFGLRLAPERRLAVMSARTAALHFGYFAGAGLGGAALAVGGYGTLSLALGALVAGASLLYRNPRRDARVIPRLRPESA